MARLDSICAKLMMSINQDSGEAYVPRGARTIKRTLYRIRQGTKLRGKHDSARKPRQSEKTIAVLHDPEYGEKSIDPATSSTVTKPTCRESTPSLGSGGLRTNSPASLVSDNANPQAETPRLVRKKGKTFPFSRSDLIAQNLDGIVNNKPVMGVMESKSEEADKSAEDSKQFVKIWELDLLPKIEDVLDSNVKGEYSINVRRGDEAGHRIIEIMTAEEVSEQLQNLLKCSKDEYLKGDIGQNTSMQFRLGTVEFLADEVPTRRSTQSEDNWDEPLNTRRYTNPLMGDSVGPNQAEGGSATIGPLLHIAQKFYHILNWHIFDDKGANRLWNASKPPALDAYHPSLAEPGEQSFSIGKTAAYSGPMHNTARVSGSIQKARSLALGKDVKETKTVTDWVLVETATGHQVNKIRKATATTQSRCNSFSESIISIADPKFGSSRLVYSTGRTSGYSFGQMSEVLGESRLWNGTKTRNWSIESTDAQVPDEAWNHGGMGIPGDSGAPVIDKETNCLLGQIWGRNKYKTNPHDRPLTYFTAMSDIYDDIRERMPELGTPRLPTNMPLAADVGRSTSPAPTTPITSDNGRRPTLASISEDVNEQLATQIGNFNQRRSVARTAPSASTRLSGYGNFPGLEPVRRWTTVIHAATL
ncbi:hypothetical protein F5Y13DRAFT_115865 [Hypoxylon sp. FL1857]|nr:hypothetical protein F5Y13DRAFT_115865 [Hypoxylon sp. FL1857]